MRVLVTGAAGFIGSNLAARLLAEGRDVVGLDDMSDGSTNNLDRASGMRFEAADLRDAAAVAGAMRGCDVVLHQAAKRSVPRSIEEPVLTTEVNVGGTLNVLEAARAVGARVVFASSSSVYGDQETLPQVESMDPRPKSPYAASKLAGEAYVRAYWSSTRVAGISLRYFNVYGPGQDPTSEYAAVVPRFIRACLTGSRPVIHGDGEQSRDFAFVDDVVEANLAAMRAPEEAYGRAFNVGGGGTPTSVNRLLEIVAGLTGSSPDPIREPARAGDMRVTSSDASLGATMLGFAPRVTIEEGLRRTVESFRVSG